MNKMGRWRGRLYATDRARDFDHERVSKEPQEVETHALGLTALQDRNVRIRQIYETIDRQPYQWIVVLVAGIGFFLDGYTVRYALFQKLIIAVRQRTNIR